MFALLISDPSLSKNSKCKKALHSGFRVLDISFVKKCIESGCVLDPGPFSLALLRSKESFQAGVIEGWLDDIF